jgi:hypothetical protein
MPLVLPSLTDMRPAKPASRHFVKRPLTYGCASDARAGVAWLAGAGAAETGGGADSVGIAASVGNGTQAGGCSMSRCRTVHARCTCGYSPVAGARQPLVGPSLLTSPACMPPTTRASVSSQPVLTHASNPVASETRLAGACAVAGSVDAVGVGTATSIVGVALVDVCSGRWEPFHSAAGHVQRWVPACRHPAPAPILRTQPCGSLPRWYSTAGLLCTPSHLCRCCQCQ